VTLLAVAVSGRGLAGADEPVLHADDEALLRGRAVFETLRVYDGRPFRLEQHLDRLAASARRISLPPVDRELVVALAAEALTATAEREVVLRFVWTPGREGAGTPRALVLVSTLPEGQDELRERGLRVVSIVSAVSPLLAGVKSTSYAANMVARDEAERRGADDALFVSADGTVLEAPTANIWWREAERLFTPSLELPILAGITRSVVAELAPKLGCELDEGVYPLERLATADEVFFSSTVREIAPAIELDSEPIGDGKPGEVARALQEALRARTTSSSERDGV
jgi:branched-subunit amino acid aminotransferase/4-amino-4-deoxychorismate lyase